MCGWVLFVCLLVDEFEIIELNSNSSTAVSGVVEGCGQQLGQDPDEPLTRGAVARRRWRSAIHQQIVLLRMDRQNHWIKGQLGVMKRSLETLQCFYTCMQINSVQ